MFIDGNNFYNLTSVLLGDDFKIDMYRLFIDIRAHFQATYYRCYNDKVFYYSALSIREDNPRVYDEHNSFLDFLRKIPFVTVKLGFLAKRPKNKNVPIDLNDANTYFHVEKETDVNISNEMLESAFRKEYDVGLLFAADGDYSDTLERLKNYNVDIYVVLPEGAPSSRLEKIITKGKIIRLPRVFFKERTIVNDEPESE